MGPIGSDRRNDPNRSASSRTEALGFGLGHKEEYEFKDREQKISGVELFNKALQAVAWR